MSDQCELHIARAYGALDGRVVRIEVRQGREHVVQVEIGLEAFARALTGEMVIGTLVKGGSDGK